MSLLEYHTEDIQKTRDIINLMNQTQDIGIESQKMLDEQYEKLQRCDKLTENININLETSSNILGRIKHFFFARKACDIKKIPKNVEDNDKMNKKLIEYAQDNKQNSTIIKSVYVNKDMENELDNNIDEINNNLKNLKNIALNINSQLELDAKLLDRINTKSDINTNNIKKINKEINKLL
jgi:hypothetical protein